MPTTLEQLLDHTYAAAVAGDLTTLASLAPKIGSAAERLAGSDLSEARLIQSKAGRNAVLLQAAMRGLQAAQARLGEILDGPALTTYDSQGRKAVLAASDATVPKRI